MRKVHGERPVFFGVNVCGELGELGVELGFSLSPVKTTLPILDELLNAALDVRQSSKALKITAMYLRISRGPIRPFLSLR